MNQDFKTVSENVDAAAILADAFQAVSAGDIEQARVEIAKVSDINALNEHGYSLVHAAITSENPDMLDLVLSTGIDVNICGDKERAPLLYAVQRDYPQEIFTRIMAANPDMTVTDKNGAGILQYWASYGRAGDLEVLQAAGMDLMSSAVDTIKHPMFSAAAGNNVENMKLMEEAGLPLFPQTDKFFTPLHIAAASNSSDVMGYLLDHLGHAKAPAGFELRESKLTPVMMAAQNGARDTFNQLSDAGFSLISQTNNGRTALFYAIEGGRLDIFEKLLASGVNIGKDKSGREHAATLMCRATALGRNEMVKLLLDHGACPNLAITSGERPLTNAAKNMNLEMVKMLLDAGADPNGCDFQNDKPLDFCVIRYKKGVSEDMARLLIDHGANCRPATGNLYRDIFYTTIREEYADLMDVFLNHNQEFRRRLLMSNKYMVTQAGQEDALSILKVMAKSGLDLNAVNDSQQNAFDRAVVNEHWAVADWLFENGVDPNQPDQNGITPFMRAVEANKINRMRHVLETLKKQGVSQDKAIGNPYRLLGLAAGCTIPVFKEVMAMLPDNLDLNMPCAADGMTALHVAVARGRPKVVKALLERGVHFEKARDNGDTPLDMALISGEAEIAEMLLSRGARIDYKSRVMSSVVNRERTDIIKLMAKNRCPMNRRNAEGHAPLHMAIKGEKLKSISALLECGASVEMTDHAGKNVYQLADGNIEILTLLSQYKKEKTLSPPRP